MTTTNPKVLILGATGQVGGAVVPYLADNPGVQVVAATRSPEKWHTSGTTAVRTLGYSS
jgi:NAD(P)H dehydrogenase (quinone)